jgi:hypothetical protein
MLGAALFNQMKAGYDQVIDLLGSPVMWTQTKPPRNTVQIIAALKIADDSDDAIVNAYGVGVRILTAKASDFIVPPVKFDSFAMGNEVYIAEAVHPVHLNNALVGYRVMVKGK